MDTANSVKPRVAILGLGIMGAGMASRVAAAGFPLAVYNRNQTKAEPFAKLGARVGSSPRDAARDAQILIAMVADDDASRSIWLGNDGALTGSTPGAILIESSTLTPDWIRELASAAAAHKCDFLDAPVTGSKVHAGSGELNFLVGGTAEALERARPVLSVLGRSILHLGPTGSGSILKLINNFLCGVQAASLGEAVALLEKSGLDPAKSLEMLVNGAGGSPLVKTLAARMAAHDYTPNFPLRWMAKDLGYASREAAQHSLPLTTAAGALEVFKQAITKGCGEKDFSAVVEGRR